MPDQEPVLIVSPRYADEVAASVQAAGMAPRVERRHDQLAQRMVAEPIRVVVVDARGALAQGLAAARSIGSAVEARHGALLMLLSRGDGAATPAAHDAGATGVLVSPFGEVGFHGALRMAARQARRMARAGGTEAAQSRHDPLTGLVVQDQLLAWLAPRMAAGEAPLVLAVGIGRIAQINAAYGRDVADRALSAAAQRLGQIVDAQGRERIRGGERLLARLAAAEFGIGIEGHIATASVQELAQTLVSAFERPVLVGERVIHLSCRVGIAGGGNGGTAVGDDAPALVRRASAALASARTGDAGTVVRVQADPDGDPLTRLADLESDLHHAIASDAISLLFQPQLSLADGQIIGVEALVRWDHPQLGLLPAETLLETAASAELATRLGRHIRARAMAAAARWTGAMARLRLSVNVTPADLADPGFGEGLAQALAESGLARRRLMLEVTEGALIDDLVGTMHLLSDLRATGVAIALDDFGTGYSSLAWMAVLPVDAIKLDRSFTQGLVGSPRERVVVETVVRLSKQLGFRVVAEGVEDDGQLEAARLAGCDGVQGFRVAPPLTIAGLADFCAGWADGSC